MKRSFRFILCAIICLLFISTSFADESTPIKWGTTQTYDHSFNSVTVSHTLIFSPSYIFRTDYPYIRLKNDNPVSCTTPGWITFSHHTTHSFGTPTGGFNCYRHIDFYMEPLNHGDTVFSSYSDATCTSNAQESGYCKYCSQTIIREKQNTQVGHKYETYTAYTPADCSNPATEIAYCEYSCGSSDCRPVGQIDPSAHHWGNWMPYENASHIRICLINENHTETNPCESELNCSICGRTAYFPETGDHSYLVVWLLLVIFSAAAFLCFRFRASN